MRIAIQLGLFFGIFGVCVPAFGAQAEGFRLFSAENTNPATPADDTICEPQGYCCVLKSATGEILNKDCLEEGQPEYCYASNKRCTIGQVVG